MYFVSIVKELIVCKCCTFNVSVYTFTGVTHVV